MIDYLARTWWGRILSYGQTEPTELLMGGFLKWLVGTWLFLPLNSFGSSPVFSNLSYLVPERNAALGLMILGAAHMLILRNGNIERRKWMAFTGCVIWFALGTFVISNTPAFGAMLFFVAALCQGWCHYRLWWITDNRKG